MNNDLISRSELKKAFYNQECWNIVIGSIIDNAPTVEIPNYGGQVVPDTLQGWKYEERPQGEYKTACNVLLSLEQIVRSSDGWEDSAVEAVHNAVQTAIKCMHERPHGDCQNCDFRKFTETFINGIVEVMTKNGIESVEQLFEILGKGNDND